MDAPDKIYVNPDLDCLWTDECPGDVEYIRKDALLEWAQEKLQERHAPQFRDAIGQLIDKLNLM